MILPPPPLPSASHSAGSGSVARRGLLLAAPMLPMLLAAPKPASAVACPGLNGYKLQQCLREERKNAGTSEDPEEARDEYMKTKQYEQPGTLVTLPNGVQYREMLEGTGRAAAQGDTLEISYIVYRLSTGAYFKYSSGGTPVLLWAVGYGTEGKDDVGDTYRFTLGERNSVPIAVRYALDGMREGGKRRVLVPPYSWDSEGKVGPQPNTFGAQRRLVNHREEALLFEAELRRVIPGGAGAGGQGPGSGEGPRGRAPYRLPAPPSPFAKNLG